MLRKTLTESIIGLLMESGYLTMPVTKLRLLVQTVRMEPMEKMELTAQMALMVKMESMVLMVQTALLHSSRLKMIIGIYHTTMAHLGLSLAWQQAKRATPV